jgi:hypothetical protein
MIRRIVPMIIVLFAAAGCGDTGAINYRPVMTLKARLPQNVAVQPFVMAPEMKGTRDAESKTRAVERALIAELAQAGYRLEGGGGVVVDGTVKEFKTTMGMGGYDTRIRVRMVVARNSAVRLDKEFDIQDGGAGITGTASEQQNMGQAALEKLMRRAVPEVVAAIDG